MWRVDNDEYGRPQTYFSTVWWQHSTELISQAPLFTIGITAQDCVDMADGGALLLDFHMLLLVMIVKLQYSGRHF